MRKKYLSALLFGAILFTPAVTFTSCSDYDDDIANLQSQITSLESSISTLQTLVNSKMDAGVYVSDVAGTESSITVTWSDGTTKTIAIGSDDDTTAQVVEVKDGELTINGEGTGIYVTEEPTEAEIEAGLVKADNGTWWVLGEDGEYSDTNIPVSGVTVSGSEAEGYVFTIYAADGTTQTVELPTAVSSITSMSLGSSTINPGSYTYDGSTVTVDDTDFLISHEEFTFNDQTGGDVPNASAWMGNKTLPSDGDFIYSSPTSIDLRINPVSIPADDISFYLTNTVSSDLSPVVMTAVASQQGSTPMDRNQVNGRATTDNGLWTLSMENQTVAKNSDNSTWNAIVTASDRGYVYAVNAGHGFRSEYDLTVQYIDAEELTSLVLNGVDGDDPNIGATTGSLTIGGTYDTANYNNTTFKVGSTYEVEAEEASALYDMYLTASSADINVFGLTFDQDNHTFTINNNPDTSTIAADFDLIVYTVANDGAVQKTVITVQVNTELSDAIVYSAMSHDVDNYNNDTHYFGIDLATMKTEMEANGNLDTWKLNADLSQTVIEWSDRQSSGYTTLPDGITTNIVTQLANKSVEANYETDDTETAAYIQVDIDNSNVDGLELDKTYYIRVTFNNNSGQTIQQIIVPVQFHAPALSELFTIKSAYQDSETGVINAYFYKITGVVADGISTFTTGTSVNLDRYFSAYVPLAELSFASRTESNYVTSDLFTMTNRTSADHFGDADGTWGHMELDFAASYGNPSSSSNLGYKEVLTINAEKEYFNTEDGAFTGWFYTTDSDMEYSFQIRLMSPIREGSIAPADGADAITISGNNLSKGASITQDMITGYTYNKVEYSVVPDAGAYTEATLLYQTATQNLPGISATDYSDPQIKSIIPSVDSQNLLQYVQVYSYYTNNSGEHLGEFKLFSSSISNNTTVALPITVTDVWGCTLSTSVDVDIEFNN